MKPCISVDDIYQIKLIEQSNISPFATDVAYMVTSVRKKNQDYLSTIYVSSLDNNVMGEPYLEIKNAKNPIWSPNNDKLCFASNESGQEQLYIIDKKNGEKIQLTTMRHGAYDPVFSPDGSKIIYLSDIFDDERVEEVTRELTVREKNSLKRERLGKAIHIKGFPFRLEGSGFIVGKKTHIWSVDIITGEQTRLAGGCINYRDHSMSPDGKYLVYVREPEESMINNPLHSELCIYDIEERSERKLLDNGLYIERPIFIENGNTILFVGHNCKYGWATVRRIYKYRPKDDLIEDLTKDFPLATSDTAISDMRGAELPSRLINDEKNKACYFICNDNGNTNLWKCSYDGGVVPVTAGKRQIYHISANNTRTKFTFTYTTNDVPCDIAIYDIEADMEKRLSYINKGFLDKRTILATEEFSFECDGISHSGWIMKPPGFDENKKYPSILEIHGGPQMMYANNFMFEFQYLASLGYVVYYSNPRGSSGFGQNFMNAIRRENGGLGGADYRDLMASCDYIEKLKYIDKERMFVTGGSYGGFMTNWIIGHTDRFRAAVTQRSICNIHSYILNSDYGYCKPTLEYDFDYITEIEEADRISPITYAENISTPLLILHSENDYRCPLEQAIEFFTELKLRNKEVELKIFPRSNHSLSRGGMPQLRIERLKSIARWFEIHDDSTRRSI